MDLNPQIFSSKVMHKRLFPKVNSFNYHVYYLFIPLPAPKIAGLFTSFEKKDLGYKDGKDPIIFANSILSTYGMREKVKNIKLITMAKIFGYVFNPVSFYLCFDIDDNLISVINEVHNTFGEQHTYFCAHEDHRPIKSDDWIMAKKVFHVSPFLERVGSYKFCYSYSPSKIAIWIDYFNEEGKKQLITSLIGDLKPLTKKSSRKIFWQIPFVTQKTIFLIHWQALKILLKKIPYVPKPKQIKEKITNSDNLTKM